jgi:hypothetical protein
MRMYNLVGPLEREAGQYDTGAVEDEHREEDTPAHASAPSWSWSLTTAIWKVWNA